jgi:cysteine desulfurase
MAAAAEWTLHEKMPEMERQGKLRDELWRAIAAAVPEARANGSIDQRLGNTLNVSFLGIDSETMLMALDLEGVCASSGSACMVGSVVASHVLLAMGLPRERASSAIRFSLGKQTTPDEIRRAASAIERVVKRMGRTKTKSDAYAVA